MLAGRARLIVQGILMTGSYSFSESFTRAHARKLAGRVTTDLYQSKQIYGLPTEGMIEEYQAELQELLAGHYVAKYQFGYKRDGTVVWSLRYSVGSDGGLVADSRGGGVPHGFDVTGALYFNFLTFSDAWDRLGPGDRQEIEEKLPFSRVDGDLPSSAGGFWVQDRGYTAGGVLVQREVFRRSA